MFIMNFQILMTFHMIVQVDPTKKVLDKVVGFGGVFVKLFCVKKSTKFSLSTLFYLHRIATLLSSDIKEGT